MVALGIVFILAAFLFSGRACTRMSAWGRPVLPPASAVGLGQVSWLSEFAEESPRRKTVPIGTWRV